MKLRAMMPQVTFPNDQTLADLVEGRLPDHYSARQLIVDSIDGRLLRVKDLLDSDDAQEILKSWSPDDSKLKSFVLFLARFDRLRFSLDGEQVRGLDMVKRMLT